MSAHPFALPAHAAPPFTAVEATVDGIHAAFRDGSLSCTSLVSACLARIAAYDREGPCLQALITVHPQAMEMAAAMDRQLRSGGGDFGPLFGIPVLLKDNFDTFDLPTTAGSVLFRDWQPAADGFAVARMRRAGALVLGKTNLQELARGGISLSSLGGQVRNPYDLTRTPGGSSGGTGAALAASFAVLGTGSDTGQSIRSPASANSLVGVRPTRGLVSRRGVMPNSFTQDEIGPLARTVTDAARLLDVMAGYDPQDPVTALGVGRAPASYAKALDRQALGGARIGIMSNLYGHEQRHAEVNRAMAQAEQGMAALGAVLIRFDLPEYAALAVQSNIERHEAGAALQRYLAQAGDAVPVRSLREIAESHTATPAVQQALEAELAMGDGLHAADYKERLLNRERLRLAVLVRMADLQLDAILYPLQRVLVACTGETEQPERNGALSHGTGLPAVNFPAGFSEPTATAPLGVPVGAELLGRDFSEARLLSLAYAYEQAWQPRRAPLATPPLGDGE